MFLSGEKFNRKNGLWRKMTNMMFASSWPTGGEAPQQNYREDSSRAFTQHNIYTNTHTVICNSLTGKAPQRTRSISEHLSEHPCRVPLQCITMKTHSSAGSYYSTDIWIA